MINHYPQPLHDPARFRLTIPELVIYFLWLNGNDFHGIYPEESLIRYRERILQIEGVDIATARSPA